MVANKGEATQEERRTSLIPVIEMREQQIRAELEQVRREADNHIRQVERQAEQYLQEGRISVSELVEKRREVGLAELQKQAEQLSRSSERHIADLQQQVKRNMALAVQRIVNAVTAVGDET